MSTDHGVVAGLLGCVFGILGILTWGIIFVPLAALCAVIGLLRAIVGRSAAGIGTSALAGVLSAIGFAVSPSLWLLVAGLLVATQGDGPTAPTTPAPADDAIAIKSLANDSPPTTPAVPPAATGQDDRPIVTNFIFAMSPEWIILPRRSGDRDQLLFRRYSVATRRQDFDDLQSGKIDRLQSIGPVGTFYNSMIYTCQHDQRKSDFVTFHLPEEVSPYSFKKDEWVSKLSVRILADGASTRAEGEYIKGDLFVDASRADEIKDFLQLLAARELIIEFGDQNDRLNFFIADKVGKVDLAGYSREVLPLMLNLPATSLRFLRSADVVLACLTYKRTGRF